MWIFEPSLSYNVYVTEQLSADNKYAYGSAQMAECSAVSCIFFQGCVVAFDKTAGKVAKIRQNAEKWGITIIDTFPQDARKAVIQDARKVSPDMNAEGRRCSGGISLFLPRSPKLTSQFEQS